MLVKAIHTEWMKLQRSPVWLAFIILPIPPAIMGTFNYLQNISILTDEWYSLWIEHTLFTCYFFLPAILGVYCSYLWRLEHTNYNWNAVMTAPVPVSCIYWAKLFAASAMTLLTLTWIGVLFVASGKLAGLAGAIPPELPGWLLGGALGGMVICAVQLCLSLVIRSFAAPVGLALIGGIAGLAALAKGYGVWFPYSLLCIGMQANGPQEAMQVGAIQLFFHSLLYLALCSLFAILWLKKRDVVAA